MNKLINELKEENRLRSEKMNQDISDYEHTVLAHCYNLTLEFIKKLENIK